MHEEGEEEEEEKEEEHEEGEEVHLIIILKTCFCTFPQILQTKAE